MSRPTARRVCALFTAALLTGCASTTTIRSTPPGATVFVDTQRVGTTPCKYSDRRTSFSQVTVRLEKEGYQPLTAVMRRDGSVELSALLFGGLLFPLIWVAGYPGQHSYVLQPVTDLEDLDWDRPPGPDTDDLY
jgi:hypothetical protein